MLHESLQELAELAPTCEDLRTVRGVLAESQDLVRNAINHGERPRVLTAWFSQLVTDVLHSDGLTFAIGGKRLVLTGAIGRGDALPSSTIRWLAVAPEVSASGESTREVAELLQGLGFRVDPHGFGIEARTKEQWREAVAHARGQELAQLADAGTWMLRHVNGHADASSLLTLALEHRPPAVSHVDGLPSFAGAVSVRHQLLFPVVAIARWAGVLAEATSASVSDRLDAAGRAGVLEDNEITHLQQAFASALDLEFYRWRMRVDRETSTLDSLPGIQRSVLSANARMVSDVLHAVAARREVAMPPCVSIDTEVSSNPGR